VSKPVPEVRPKASALQVMRAVLWSFIGIRKSSGYADDVAKIRPAQVIVAGLLAAAVFVGSLVVLVKFLTAK
jgi:amino acid transporter